MTKLGRQGWLWNVSPAATTSIYSSFMQLWTTSDFNVNYSFRADETNYQASWSTNHIHQCRTCSKILFSNQERFIDPKIDIMKWEVGPCINVNEGPQKQLRCIESYVTSLREVEEFVVPVNLQYCSFTRLERIGWINQHPRSLRS